jgi:hypothetical protein
LRYNRRFRPRPNPYLRGPRRENAEELIERLERQDRERWEAWRRELTANEAARRSKMTPEEIEREEREREQDRARYQAEALRRIAEREKWEERSWGERHNAYSTFGT